MEKGREFHIVGTSIHMLIIGLHNFFISICASCSGRRDVGRGDILLSPLLMFSASLQAMQVDLPAWRLHLSATHCVGYIGVIDTRDVSVCETRASRWLDLTPCHVTRPRDATYDITPTSYRSFGLSVNFGLWQQRLQRRTSVEQPRNIRWRWQAADLGCSLNGVLSKMIIFWL